ncbi:MAG TPA: tetratricopeptide repeat protein [Chroococcales cyanobacterium]
MMQNPDSSKDPVVELHGLASIYHKYGKLDLAERLYQKLLALNPDSTQGAIALYGLAQLYKEQGRSQESANCLKRALGIWAKLHPEDSLGGLNFAAGERGRPPSPSPRHLERPDAPGTGKGS